MSQSVFKLSQNWNHCQTEPSRKATDRELNIKFIKQNVQQLHQSYSSNIENLL